MINKNIQAPSSTTYDLPLSVVIKYGRTGPLSRLGALTGESQGLETSWCPLAFSGEDPFHSKKESTNSYSPIKLTCLYYELA